TTDCATQTLNLTITPSTNTPTTISACDSYTWAVNGQTYTQSGTYTSTTDCATQTLNLTITPSTNNTTTITECDSYTWSVNGETYTQSGTYTDTDGCATETLVLTIVSSTNNTTTVSACDSYTWNINGETYTESGTYTSVSGCGTQTLELTITPSTNTPTTISACDSYTWAVNGQTYTQSGTYTSTTGCATQTLNLTITESTNNITTVTECDSYTWSVNGETYTQSGTYTETDGCETETLVLTIVSSSNNVTTISACDSYTWSINGETYTQSGTYTSVSGCGTQTLELTITPSSTNSTPLSVCGASYTWPINGQTYTQSGSYTALNGCVTEVLVLTLTVPGTPCDDGNSGTINDTWSQNCTCVGTPVGCEQFVNLVITTDDNGGQTTWEILPEGGGTALCTGGPYTGINNATLGEQCCLVDGCYALRVYDSAGDGMTTGGYVLKEGGQQGRRIIDNSGDGVFGSVSAIAGGQGFCLPLGDDRLIFAHCDREFWLANQYIVATENPAVSAMWVVGGANGVQPSNSGYEFWIFDPDGTYSYRRFRSHNVSDGYSPANALRACHMKVNSWFANALNPHIPSNVLMNVRIRGRVAGSNLPFGPACRFKIDPALAQCPPTTLVNTPGTLEFSCGVVKPFGTNTSKIYAWSRPGANRYQFEFTVPGEGDFLKVVTNTNNIATLNWTVDALVPGVTYDVRVRVSKNQGATWCPWGEVCYLTIENNTPAGSMQAPATEGALSTELAQMEVLAWPNPNRGDRITLAVTNLGSSVERIGVELYDLTGKRILADMIAAQDGMVNTNIELNNTQSGVYLLRVTAGDVVTTDRIVVQH
ncbi:MAG TPA: T9SS type A sorting domain-containing protein, partial [Flavobacteriales bacterium]|nr:T9SS type A sorting domain-containing protein [Flavobacteriales bacterium]